MFKSFILILFFLIFSEYLFCQDVTVIPALKSKSIRYAMMSSDGKYLAVADAVDTLHLMDPVNFRKRKSISILSSAPYESMHYTGRKIFHISDKLLFYVSVQKSQDSVRWFLVTEELATGNLKAKTQVGSIVSSLFDQEKSWNRMTYGMSVNGATLLYFLNDEIIAFDLKTGHQVQKWNMDYVFFAAQNEKATCMAYLTSDSVHLVDLNFRKIWSCKNEGSSGLLFRGDSLILYGEKIFVLSISEGKKILNIYKSRGNSYGAEISGSQRKIGFSLSYFEDQGFASVLSSQNLSLSEVYHLPKTQGFISFFNPLTDDLWLITAKGFLYRFSTAKHPVPMPQYGHRRKIINYSFSKDKKLLLSTGEDQNIIVWDLHTGRIQDRIGTNQTLLSHAVFDKNDKDIVFIKSSEYIKIHRSISSNADWGTGNNVFQDPEEKPYIDSLIQAGELQREKQKVLARKYGTSEDSHNASSSRWFTGYITKEFETRLRVANLKTGEFRDLDLPKGMRMSGNCPICFYNEDVIIVEGERNTISLIDLTSGKELRKLGLPRQEFYPGMQKILFNEGGDTMVTVNNLKVIQVWDLRKGERIFRLVPPLEKHSQVDAVSFANGKLSFFTQNQNTYISSVYDLSDETMKTVACLDTNFYIRQENVECAAYKGKGYPSKMSLSPDGKRLIILRVNSENLKIQIFLDYWDLKNMKMIKTIPVPDLFFPDWDILWSAQKVVMYDSYASSKSDLEENMKQSQSFGIKYEISSYTSLKFIDLATGKINDLDLDKIGIKRIGKAGVKLLNEKEAWISDGYYHSVSKLNLKTRKLKLFGPDKTSFAETPIVGSNMVANDSIMIFGVYPYFNYEVNFQKWDLITGKKDVEAAVNASHITCFSKMHPTGSFAIGMKDNAISIRNTSNLKERYRIVQNEEGNYVFMTPQNYYKADRSSASALFFNWNFKTFSLTQFDAWFNRPDKVLEATGFSRKEDIELLEKAYKKRNLAVKNIILDSLRFGNLPEITIENLNEIPFQTHADSIKIQINASDMLKGIAGIKIKVNGVPVSSLSGFSKKTINKQVRISTYVKLLSGRNKISINAENSEGLSSLPDEVLINNIKAPDKPDLYLVTVAIKDYKNPAFNLTYSVKDAKDLTAHFQNSKGFGTIYSDTLFDAQVNQKNILFLKKKLLRSRPQDVVIVFFAGHGVLDENFDFRFAAWDFNVNKPAETGILYDDIEKLLDGIQSRNKLMLVDACHSGDVDKDEIYQTVENLENSSEDGSRTIVQKFSNVHHNVFKFGLVDRKGFELMQDMFFGLGSNTGAQVVVATAGDSYALESNEWKNGVFTYSLLNGIKSGAADLDLDKVITVDEMVNYLKTSVPMLTSGKQKPRYRQENPDNSFVIWRY